MGFILHECPRTVWQTIMPERISWGQGRGQEKGKENKSEKEQSMWGNEVQKGRVMGKENEKKTKVTGPGEQETGREAGRIGTLSADHLIHFCCCKIYY